VDIRCDVCGREAPGGAWFRVPGESPRSPPTHRCPACFARKEKPPRHPLLYLFLAGTMLGYAAVVVAPAGHFGWLLLNVSLFFALLGLVVFAHELGHALAAWLLGLRVFTVRLGSGPLLASATLGGTEWVVGAVLSHGATVVGHPNLRAARLKNFLVTLAGPAVNGAFLVAAFCWRPPSALWEQVLGWFSEPGLLVLPLFAAANGLSLMTSLTPIAFDEAGKDIGTDGQQLLELPYLSEADLTKMHAAYFHLEGRICEQADRREEALGWYERGLEHYPDDEANALGAAWVLLGLGEFEKARRRLAPLLAREDLGENCRALAAEVMATAALFEVILLRLEPSEGSPDREGAPPPRLADLLAEAERWCQEGLSAGMHLPPESRWITMGLYGCLLVEQGKAEAGAEVLLLALEEVESPAAKAYCLSYLAVAAARQGLGPQARAALEKARQLAPGHITVERAEWELAQGA
jgi:tetratricopeptide (TPR) repeat protein